MVVMMMADSDKPVTFRVTERCGSLSSYQCGNGGGVHWSVARGHQHRLQNNRRKRVIVQGMQKGTGEEQWLPIGLILRVLHIHLSMPVIAETC